MPGQPWVGTPGQRILPSVATGRAPHARSWMRRRSLSWRKGHRRGRQRQSSWSHGDVCWCALLLRATTRCHTVVPRRKGRLHARGLECRSAVPRPWRKGHLRWVGTTGTDMGLQCVDARRSVCPLDVQLVHSTCHVEDRGLQVIGTAHTLPQQLALQLAESGVVGIECLPQLLDQSFDLAVVVEEIRVHPCELLSELVLKLNQKSSQGGLPSANLRLKPRLVFANLGLKCDAVPA